MTELGLSFAFGKNIFAKIQFYNEKQLFFVQKSIIILFQLGIRKLGITD